MIRLKSLIFHPMLFSLFPILSLYAYNQSEISVKVIWRPLIVSLILSILLWLGVNIITNNWHKSAFATTMILLWFFSYSKLRDYVFHLPKLGPILGNQGIFAAISIIVLALVIWLLLTRFRQHELLTSTLNIITVTALIISVSQMAFFSSKIVAYNRRGSAKAAQESENLIIKESHGSPDIYYIILDEYSRDDVLLNEFNFDNTAFLESLRAIGFHVPKCALSNYGTTAFSLASSLNMNYLPQLGVDYSKGSGIHDNNDIIQVWELLQHNKVREELERIGYRSVAFDTGVFWSNVSDSTIYYAYNDKPYSSFENQIIVGTAAQSLLDEIKKLNPEFIYHEWYYRQLYNLSKLKEAIYLKGPKFVYAHILIPHGPNVFGPNGEFNYRDDKQGYRNQVTFINSYVLGVIQDIISQSNPNPIIILQGDHGSRDASSTLPILNAYFLPEGGNALLYSTITPVNTFRLIFDYYFNSNLAFLNDISYNSDWEKDWFDFTIFHDTIQDCALRQ